MGSAGGILKPDVCQRVRQLGVTIARRGHILITGACPGIPHEAVLGAKSAGGTVVGISPGLNLKEHVTKYHSPTRGYDAMIYTGSGLMGREIENIRSCDVVIFAGGRSGTLSEFAIAYDEGKVIGVLQNSGGISDQIDKIIDMIQKKTEALVCYEADPERLMDKLEEIYKNQIIPQHLKFLADHNPDGVLEE